MKENVLSAQLNVASADDPVVVALCTEQQNELDARYESVTVKGLEPQVPFMVAWIDGAPIGCAGLQSLEPGIAEIRRMYVRPAHRGQGISRQLLTAIEELAREHGELVLRLETGDLQPEALGLYQSAGYVRIPPFGEYIGSSLSLCFEKHL